MKSSDIIKKLELIYKPSMGKRAVLIDGKWGIGKTYTYTEYIKKNKYQSIYISLFNINSLEEIDKKIISKYFIKEKNQCINLGKKVMDFISDISKENIGIGLNELIKFVDINTLKYKDNTIICFDDLERLNKNIDIESVLGKIEQLHNKVKIAVICNSEKLSEENKKVFNEYKEKVIDNNYVLDELDVEFIKDFMKELNLKDGSKEVLIKFFLENGNNNLRYLKRIKDSYIEIKEVCNQEEWFLNKEKEIIEAVACLEAENCFKLYSNKNLETLKAIEESILNLNPNKEQKSEDELKKEINFLDEIYGDMRKIVELLNSYNIKNTDIKRELKEYFSNEKIYKEYYQLCYLEFLKGENEILDSFNNLKAIFNKNFDKISYRDKYTGFIVLNRYLKDLKSKNSSIDLSLNNEKNKIKSYIKNLLKEGEIIDFGLGSGIFLDEFNLDEEKNILLNIQKEAKKEAEKEIENEISEILLNKKFKKIEKLRNRNIKINSYEAVKEYFDILLSKSCPYEYWEYYDDIFKLLTEQLKKQIIEKINNNAKNKDYSIIRLRNRYLKRNLKI